MAPDPSPASPSPADLTASLVAAYAEHQRAIHALAAARSTYERAVHAKAFYLGKGGLCAIGGVTYRAKPPRKAKGQAEDPSALWTLEKVEVGE